MSAIYLEGNNGGDYLAMRSLPDGRIQLEVGHCCVVYVSKIMPVEILTSVVAQQLEIRDPEKWEIDFETEYSKTLRSQVTESNTWARGEILREIEKQSKLIARLQKQNKKMKDRIAAIEEGSGGDL